MSKEIAQAVSHTNIALIKYWGKKDIFLNIPTNASISILLPNLKTETTIVPNDNSDEDIFILDGVNTKIKDRMSVVIAEFKNLASNYQSLKIVSHNNFPSSCGLASSASGFSALVKALNIFYNLNLDNIELSKLARLGSGSACRSIEDGISKWENEYAYKIGEWDDLRIFNIILNKNEKKISSTEGMIRTKRTSNLFKARLNSIEDKLKMAEVFIKQKDFVHLGDLVMKESNEMHAIFMDTYPPILYLTQESMKIIYEIHNMNDDGFKAFYSFDAGPNPFIFVLEKDFEEVYQKFSEKYETIIGK